MCAPIAKVTAACAAPEARRTPLEPPAAARITSGLAMGAKASMVSLRRPPERGRRAPAPCGPAWPEPPVRPTTIATSGKPARCRIWLGKVPLAVTASAQPPARISTTGSRICEQSQRGSGRCRRRTLLSAHIAPAAGASPRAGARTEDSILRHAPRRKASRLVHRSESAPRRDRACHNSGNQANDQSPQHHRG